MIIIFLYSIISKIQPQWARSRPLRPVPMFMFKKNFYNICLNVFKDNPYLYYLKCSLHSLHFYFCQLFLNVFKEFIFQSGFRFTAKFREGTEISHLPSAPHLHNFLRYQHPSQSDTFLQLVNLYGHLIITQSPQFALGVIHSISQDNV